MRYLVNTRNKFRISAHACIILYLLLLLFTSMKIDINDRILCFFTTLAVASILLNQPLAKILVGDPHQQIYGFRGATNAMAQVTATHTYYLTQVYAAKNILLIDFIGKQKLLVFKSYYFFGKRLIVLDYINFRKIKYNFSMKRSYLYTGKTTGFWAKYFALSSLVYIVKEYMCTLSRCPCRTQRYTYGNPNNYII